MKIKIIKDIKIPNGQYKTGNIINTDLMNEIIRKDCENLYNIFIKAGYAEEVKEPQNKFDSADRNLVVDCQQLCDGLDCKDCKYKENGKFVVPYKISNKIEELLAKR